ncbi:ArnT family glycosyltransferase [Dactylosporangium sucinum]|uniref:Glycosyltransferase RgtA/B/C/D-like domain-containing protein n=1 Tax=Dactylosporangium sucinum TaxID=1424081 RepID=A0A917UDV8_9ACTN|nr:hypothetical protein [Dactylosporangium sucinum]GGM85884.1 hypothetical protein GCM10007977_104690 [Dactylosporangium sucinum]
MIVAPTRLALIRAGIVVAVVAVLTVEGLSLFDALHRVSVVVLWLLVLGLAAVAFRRARPAWRPFWRDLGLLERLMVVALGGFFLVDLVVAVVAPPNNFDSQTYHLPKIEHWVAQGNVDFYPTIADRQLAMAPGAEYLLLHLRLLTGGDALYNLVQLAAGVGGALIASRIAAQLGGARRAQLLAALVFGTAPMVLLEATSTQTDLVVALWVGAVATLVLDELHRRTPWPAVLLIGAAAGLTLLTKATGLLAAGPLLAVWCIAQLRRGALRGVLGGLALVACMALLSGPYLWRVQTTYENPLGPDHLRGSISMQRHDPAAVLINALRISETALQTPLGPVGSGAIVGLADALGVDPSGRDITYWGATYPYRSWPPDEDRVSFPIQGALVLLGAAVLLFRRGGPRLYAALFWVAVLAYVVTVKWQPWGNRLILFLLLMGAPLAALWVDPLLSNRRRVVSWTMTGVLAAGALAGAAAVSVGFPRRLVGQDNIFTTPELEQRFVRRPAWQADYTTAADAVRAAGAHRIGLVQGYNTWEYPWWVLLPDRDFVSLQSLQPDRPAASIDSVDAVLCMEPPKGCDFYVPSAWPGGQAGEVTWAIRPR